MEGPDTIRPAVRSGRSFHHWEVVGVVNGGPGNTRPLQTANGTGLYPPPLPSESSRDYLRRICYAGAKWRYGDIRPDVGRRLEYELGVIEQKGLCDYFLIVWDIVRFARSRGIRATGRGSAGDSIVSYVLDLTHADPLAHDLLFERFLNPERHGMPDIDVDFCARRRDEVTAYVYERYGAEHVAAVCTLNTFRARSALREIGKALAMDERELGPLAAAFPYIRANKISEAALKLPEVRDSPFTLEDKGLLLELCQQISGYPRHLSVHVGGLVIGAEPLTRIMPLELACKGIVISAFDKDDVEALGMLKVDILGLRIHTATDDCLKLIEQRTGRRLDLEALPLDDEATFRLLRSTNTIGLFQVESPGQRNLLGRAQPREFEEVIANISLFRPGPVQSDMTAPTSCASMASNRLHTGIPPSSRC
jgi:DNA polymerase III alpha subunit